MGTRMAPNYAIIFMHYLETNFLTNYPTPPKLWLRFIDDIFMIWKDREQQLRMFLEALNNYHPTIKFTHNMDKKEIAFLDSIVYRSATNRIYTRIYHNQQIRNNIYTTIQPTLGTKKNLSLRTFSSDVEEYAQKTIMLRKKLNKYITN